MKNALNPSLHFICNIPELNKLHIITYKNCLLVGFLDVCLWHSHCWLVGGTSNVWRMHQHVGELD